MSTLPLEIITEILSFLPPESLCRFKSVAKSWHFLITSEAFIKLHLSKTLISDQPPNLIIRDDGSLFSAAISAANPNELSFSAVDHPKFATIEIVGSCRGILCISDEFKKTVFLFNPSTIARRLIPQAPTEIDETHLNPFVYKLIDHIVVFGFGYDSSVDDYKLLKIIERYMNRVCICREVRLYSMRSNSWKIVEVDFDDYAVEQMDAVHVNGVLYFAVSDEKNETFVKCFDLKTEEFSVFDMFELDKRFYMFSFMLAELGGCFAVMVNYSSNDLLSAELWVRKEGSWVRVFQVSDPFKIGRLTHIWPVTYSKDGGKVLLEVGGSKFCWFDWGSNEFTRVKACGIPSKDSPFYTNTFVPSIVSLRSDEDKAKDERKGKGKVVQKKNVNNRRNLDGFLSTGFKLRL